MKESISKLALAISRTAFAFAMLTSVFWLSTVISQNGWFAAFYWIFAAPWIGGAALFLGVIPSSILYAKLHQQRDLASLKWSSAAFLIVVVESALLLVVPLHGS
jgi:hypothetical protein